MPNAARAGSFASAGTLPVNRLGFGAMRLPTDDAASRRRI